MEQYDEKAWYKFTDKDGNVHYSRGDNGYIWQAYTEGIPLSVNDKGEWYTEPYLDVTPNGFVSHIPDWFKDTKEYSRWMNEFVPQLTSEGASITADRFNQYKDMLSSLGSMGGTRQAYRKFIQDNYNVTDKGLQDAYVDTMYAVQLEGKEKEKAQISGIFGSDQVESAEDIARSFKNLSKEKLAEITTKLYWNMDKAKDGSTNLSQKEIADAVTTMGILSYIDENYKEFGDGEEFKGLLEASEWQKFARQLKNFQQTWAESGIWGIGARFMYGIGELAAGRDFSLRIEDDRERSYLSPAFGGSLKGLEASDRIGNLAGMAASFATQFIVSKGAGYLFNGKIMPMLNLGEKWSKVGTFLQTVPGAMTSDFILNDVPIDGLFLATDLMKYGGDWGKAWENPEEQQNLIPIPGIGEFGPKVPAGLKYNLLGDAIVDLALPIVNIVFGNFHNKLDLLSNGGLTRVEDKIALQNLKLQQKLTDLPVVGTGWKKFVNFMMGEADAEKVRLARKAAIAEGSMRPYEEVHNLLTLNNHEGAEVVNPMLKKLDKDYKISESVQDFVKNKNQYGGIGETKVDWKDIEPGAVKKGFKGYDDILPRDVKQGLLDIERLSELKGEALADGGIFSNPTRGAEIEKLENKVKKIPKKIRDFADRFSDYNKAMDQLRVELDLTTQQWEDALQADPRWEKYMTRQALVPGGGGPGTGTDPTQAKIITKGRKGYYAENYLDPYIAVNMKGVALGRAYAWNEMKKALYSYEAALGNVVAGKGGASTAAKLAEKRAEIKSKEELKKAVGYDDTVGSFSTDMTAISGSFRRISELLDRPGEISLKSVYGATQNPQIKAVVNDFNNGKITFAPGVKEAAGLTDSVAADIIQNTYAYNKVNPVKVEAPKTKETPDIPRDSADVWNDRMTQPARFVDGRNYAKDVTPDSRKNTEGYKKFKEEHLEKIDAKVLPEDVEDFVLHIIRPGGDVDEYNSYLRNSDYDNKEQWARYYIDDLSERYIDDIEDIAYQFFPSETKRVADKAASETLYDDVWSTNSAIRSALADMLAEKLIQGMEGNYRLKDNTILYRGVNTGGTKLNPAGDFSWIKEGGKFKDNGFGFVSLSDNAARHYADGGKGEKIILEYKVPEGQRLFYFGEIGKGGNDGGAFVLPAEITGTVGKIVDGEDGYKHVEILIGDAAKADATTVDKMSVQGADMNIPDNLPKDMAAKVEAQAQQIGYNAGMSVDGVPYKYEIENGQITKMEKITDIDGLAESVRGITGTYDISTQTVERLGELNVHAINRALIKYRDNIPIIAEKAVFKVAYDEGSLGWCPKVPDTLHIENGKLVADEFEVFLSSNYYAKGKEESTYQYQKSKAGNFHPKNSGDLSSTPIHENGHSTSGRLTISILNQRLEEGNLDINRLQNMSSYELKWFFVEERDKIQADILKTAAEKIGIKPTPQNINTQRQTISGYANYDRELARRNSETIAEAFTDYFFNGVDSSPFSQAIVGQFKERMNRFTVAAAPGEVFKKNGLTAKGLFKDDEYAFPKTVKTDAQKAKWLDQWRQKNPYLKGELTEETYKQANLWDTFFQKEIAAYDAKAKSVAPDLLIEKNANFLENLSKNSAKMLVKEIKQASIEGFDEALATMALSKKSTDIADAMDEFIINRVEKAANEIASKMPGGATEENLNTARITLWSEDSLKTDVVNMVYTMVPNGELAAVQEKIGKLFDTQAEGYASFEALPVDVRKLYGEEKRLQEQLARDNKYALQKGKEEDAKLKEQGYRNGSKVVSFRDGGETVYVVLNDPLEASLFERPNNYKETNVFWESVAQMSNFLARTYRLGTTGMNPVALVRNILRDPLQATLTAGFSPLSMHLSPDVFFHTLRGYGLDDATISEVSEKIKNWASSNTLTQEIRNFSNTRVGSTGYRSKAEKYIKKFNQGATENKIVKLGEKPLEMWESMFRTQVGQQSFMRNYQRTRDVNKALGAALFDTSNATTNFSHSVAHLRRATSTIPYLTSAINGTTSFWRLFNMNPVRMITRLTAGFMVPAMAITAWNLSDKEKRQAYLNLPEWFRQGHIVLLDNENNVFALPIPEEIDQFYNVARKYIEFTQESTPFALPTIMAQGVFGFLPLDVDGFFGDDGSIQIGRGVAQLANGIMPQAATAIYELAAKKNLFTGQDISDYDGWNTFLNTTSNIFGTGWKQVINSIGLMCGVPESRLVGKSVGNTLARDLFGIGFDDATTQFMRLVGHPSEIDPDTGKETKATGLFAESEDLAKKIEKIEDDIIFASEDQKAELEKKKQDLINDFTQRVANMTNKYMQLYTITGGLEDWKKKKIVQILTLGQSISSGDSLTYQYNEANQAGLDERGLALQRYVDAGLPAQADQYSFADSIDLQAAVNRFYGTNKQATQDFKNAVEQSGMKDVKDEFYSVINQIYDAAEEQNKQPDYDLIERIQARYLQMMDSALIPLINQYGINVLNNNDFIDAVRRQVNGMIPSDDWRQSAKNAKRFLSTKEFPTATVDVKKWLKSRYSSGMRDRGLDSDPEVTERIESIRADIDAGRMAAAAGKIEDLKKGVNKANFYISSKDLMTLNDLQNMVK